MDLCTWGGQYSDPKSYKPKSLCSQESQHKHWRSTQKDQQAGDINHRWETFKTPLGLYISGLGVLGILWYANVILQNYPEKTMTILKDFIAQRFWMTCLHHPSESLEEQMTELRSCQWQMCPNQQFSFAILSCLFKVLMLRRVQVLMSCSGHSDVANPWKSCELVQDFQFHLYNYMNLNQAWECNALWKNGLWFWLDKKP